jgi:transcriptional regulator with GAF, ATPase, and Fis domain
MTPHPDDTGPRSAADLFLRAASGVFSELLTLDDLLHTILDKVVEVTGATKVFLILVGRDGTLDFRVARNMQREEIENPRNRISRNLIGRVLQTGSSVLTGHAGQDPRFQDAESVHNLLLKSILCVPLRLGSQVGGVIYLENHLTTEVFDERHRKIVERVAEQASLALGMASALESLKGERDRLEAENQGLREVFQSDFEFGRFIGRSPAMVRVAAQMARMADSRHTVLIRGESGTGKELVARLIHATGPWRDKPFVAVNCAAVPSGLFESELFGHVKGAFTGAERNRVGKVEAAHGGTLFLDEVGDLPLDVQPKLLRLLQERTYERVGDNEIRKADLRVIAATNKELASMVQAGRFREDLYFRLNQLPIVLPTLRERPEDIPELAEYFLRQEGRKLPGFTPAALAFLTSYRWPGNIRDLRNTVLRAAIYTTDGELIDVDALRAQIDERESRLLCRPDMVHVEVPAELPYRQALARLEEGYLREALRRYPDLSRAELAERIGIPRRTLFQRLKDLGFTNVETE